MKETEKYPWIGRRDRRETLLLVLTILFWIINLAMLPLWSAMIKHAVQIDRTCFGLVFLFWPSAIVKLIEVEFLPREWDICTASGSPVRCRVYPDGCIEYDVADTLSAYYNKEKRKAAERSTTSS